MKVRDFASKFNMKVLTGENGLDKEITGVYICDLLSWVMSHVETGNAWITVLTHMNIIAVAILSEVSCIIIPEDIKLEEATLNKAIQEGVAVLSTDMNSYKISCKAYGMI